jgi:putative peptidoglycan lipid II flippase
MPAQRRSLVKTSLLLLPMHVVFRAGEAMLPILLAAWFGRNEATDVYYFAWAVFAFAGSLVFSAYADSAIIPIIAEVKLATPKEWPRVTGSLLTHTLCLATALSVGVGLVALGWFRFRYDGASFALAAATVPIFSAYLVALTIKTFFVSILNSEHRFSAFPVASSIGTVITIAMIASLRGSLGVLSVPLASLCGELAAVGILGSIIFSMLRLRMKLTFDRPEPVKKFARLVAYDVAGGAVTRINPVLDQLMAGLAGVIGGGTLLRLSGDVSSLATSLVGASLLSVLLSHLSDDFAARDYAKIRHTVIRALVYVSAILVAVSAILYLVRVPLLRLVFLRGDMDADGVDSMARIFPYHLVGLAPFGALLVLAKAHVAMKNTSIMVGMGLLNAGLNAVLNVVFLRVMGLAGIALATSVMHLAVAVVFWIRFESKLARERVGQVPTTRSSSS